MTPLSEYLKQIEKALQAGYSTEPSHYPTLKALIESLSKGLTATNNPKHIACGAPDFIVTKGGVPLGYIECKDVGERRFDEKEAVFSLPWLRNARFERIDKDGQRF